MSFLGSLKVSMFEANVENLALEGMSFSAASQILKNRGLMILYECTTKVLTDFHKDLYEKVLVKVPREIALFMDPLIVSFALKDACDVSGANYVWLDLEGDGEVGCSAWVKEAEADTIVNLAIDLLRRHLEKYVIDVYNFLTRENMAKVWEAGFGLQECLICGAASLERKIISANKHKFRGWTCKSCGHHVVVPSDILNFLNINIEDSI